MIVPARSSELGVGRSRTYYRQIAVNDVQRGLLKESVNSLVQQYGRWEQVFDAALQPLEFPVAHPLAPGN